MELAYDEAKGILHVSWSDDLSVESARFLQTVVYLFTTIQEQKVSHLIIDSGLPAGGVLTEEVIQCFIHHIPHTTLRKIALLDSPDYLWDYNLLQVISLLVANYKLPIEVKLVSSHAAGLRWFAETE
ncbi:hypothetical protein [Pontibacter kalidii]|uniref:hypothetical protein n=1 Tax=Pontibacter kalidii TaxID=2592049 RepID=UPI00225BFD95|nr:hypothetical protein [Pontibacter kalidii]